MDSKEVAMQLVLKLMDTASVSDQLLAIKNKHEENGTIETANLVVEMYKTIYKAVDKSSSR